MSDKYKVVSEFECHGKPMVTVRIGSAAHVMSLEEWRKINWRSHQDRWKNIKVDCNSFEKENSYRRIVY